MTPTEPYWRYSTPRDPSAPSFGARVGVIAAALGTPLMPHQQWIADVATEHDGAGRYRYPFVIVTLPRRGGKTALLGAVALERMFRVPDYGVYFTAQTQQDAGERFDELVKLIKRSPFAARASMRYAAGSKRITLPNDASFRLFKPSPDAVHGSTVGTGMIDEAFDLSDAAGHGIIGAIRPAQLTLDGRAQIWIVSTEGHAGSSFLHYWIDQGRAAAPGVALFEIGAPPEADASDPAVWQEYHPAHGRILSTDDLHTEAAVMDPAEFRRAYLNMRTATRSTVIDMDRFRAAAADLARPGGPIIITYDAAHGATAGTVLGTWLTPDRRVAHKIIHHRPGIEWMADAVAETAAAIPHTIIAADDGGAARQITDELSRRPLPVTTLPGRDLATAFGAWHQLITTGQLAHDGTEPMSTAAAALTTKQVGDATAPSRRASPGDISPAIAAIVGAWMLPRSTPEAPPVISFGSEEVPA